MLNAKIVFPPGEPKFKGPSGVIIGFLLIALVYGIAPKVGELVFDRLILPLFPQGSAHPEPNTTPSSQRATFNERWDPAIAENRRN